MVEHDEDGVEEVKVRLEVSAEVEDVADGSVAARSNYREAQ